MKSRIIFLICFLIFILETKFSYTQQANRTVLKWHNIQKYKFDNDSIKCLYFDGAVYEPETNSLPYFCKLEKINSFDNNIKAYLHNQIFQEIDDVEATQLSDLIYIKEKIEIKTSLSIQEKQPFANIKFIPIRKNNLTGKYERLVSFTLTLDTNTQKSEKPFINKQTWADNSVLNQGKWYKIAVNKNGIYKLTYEQLISMGLNITDPRKIRIYGNGGGMLPEIAGDFRYDDLVENAIYVSGENDGSFDAGDYVLFYGESPNNWYYDKNGDKLFHHKKNLYADYNYYFINADLGLGKRITSQFSSSDASNVTVSDFDDYNYHELDTINFGHAGKNWYGERFDVVTAYNFPFSFPDINLNGKSYIKTEVLAHSSSTSQFIVKCADTSKTIYVPSSGKESHNFAAAKTDWVNFSPNSSNLNVSFTYIKNPSNSYGFLNYMEIFVRRNLNFSGNQLIFRDKNAIGEGNVADFILSNANANIKIWDITNPHDAKMQEYTLNGNILTFRLHTDSLLEFIAFNGNYFETPTLIGNVENQNLHGFRNAKFIIVTHPNFLNEANRLADFHRNLDNISVLVATTEQVYNEFSSGKQDVAAIRNLVKMFYDRANNPDELPKNLLLFGDASFDYKNRIESNTNFVPTFELEASLNDELTWVTDDFYGLLDNTEGRDAIGALDIGVGRLPVKSLTEAENSVNKIMRYASKTNLVTSGNTISNFADWKNTICLVADDGEENWGDHFMINSEQLADIIKIKSQSTNIDKIYLDAFKQVITPGGSRFPDANQAINKRFLKGALIINYIGHSGENGWALERVLTVSDINNWTNKYNMPMVFTSSCSFCRFDDPAKVSAGELLVLNPFGGGIVLYAAARVSYLPQNQTMSINFYNSVFDKSNDQYYTLGELFKFSKGGTADNSIKSYTLMGDPALKLSYPQYNVVTTLINNDSISGVLDTLKAFSKVTVNGYVADLQNNKLTDFNGKIYPTIFDKFTNERTLGNDPDCPPFDYTIQKNILYRGKVSVKNGDFNFTFLVPKDINYTFGNGKISYYAENGNADASGYFDNFIIGGTDTTAAIDNQGPEVRLFMNDENFIRGGITNENPSLFSLLNDISGINTVGNGIGHDIVAVLDNNDQNPFILNDYYQANLDSYQSGSITYPFLNLKEGFHTLKLRAWDIYNNSTEAYTDFIVAKSSKIALQNILNYPNPFNSKTTFRFEHNQSNTELDIQILIFSLNGSLIKTIEQKVQTTGFIADQIDWDGKDNYGKKLSSGFYIYKIKIGNKTNGFIEKSQKLVIIN